MAATGRSWKNKAGQGGRPGPGPLTVEVLEERTLLSVTLGAMGDSITAPYTGTYQGSGGDRSWVELLQMTRSPGDISIQNVARGGATSGSLLAQGQHTRVANLVASGAISSATLIIGANDVTAYEQDILAGRYDRFINTVVPNITSAVTTVLNAGAVELVVADIPDIGVTPLVRAQVHDDPVLLGRISAAISQANDQILSLAAADGIPVVDLFGLTHAIDAGPIELGGVEVSRFFAPDNYHPSTISQALLANTLLAGLQIGYGEDVTGLPLSDQEILALAGIDHDAGETYFDVSPYVIFNTGGAPHAPQQSPGWVGTWAARQKEPAAEGIAGGEARVVDRPLEMMPFFHLETRIPAVVGGVSEWTDRQETPGTVEDGMADPAVTLLVFRGK
jgi:lysophospholipase L1-like esterase